MPPTRKQPPQIDVCSLRQDLSKAQEIHTHLMGLGVKSRLVSDAVKSGQNWADQLRESVEEADGLIICLRPGFEALARQEEEVFAALETARQLNRGESFFIPFVVEPVPGGTASSLEDLDSDLKKRYSLPKRSQGPVVCFLGRFFPANSGGLPKRKTSHRIAFGIKSSAKQRQWAKEIIPLPPQLFQRTRPFLMVILVLVIALVALVWFWPFRQDELLSLRSTSQPNSSLQTDQAAAPTSGTTYTHLTFREKERSRHGYRPEAIVVHVVETDLAETARSFHYGIADNGEIQQYVEDEATAFHLGKIARSRWDLFKPGVDANYYTIGIAYTSASNQPWSDKAYQANTDLIARIAQRWNLPVDRNHVVGHYEISGLDAAGVDPTDPTRSLFCPGSGVDLDHLVGLAAGTAVAGLANDFVAAPGTLVTRYGVNVRRLPSMGADLVGSYQSGTQVTYVGWVRDGELVKGNSNWYKTEAGHYIWAGGTSVTRPQTP